MSRMVVIAQCGRFLCKDTNVCTNRKFFLHFEAYFYFNVSEGNMICHLMGEPQQERVVWLANEQAIMSPEWSIHAAAGTSNYMFIWGMAGENLDYSDMDKIPYTDMR